MAVSKVGLKTKPHLKSNLSCKLPYCALGLAGVSFFARVLGCLPTTQDGLQGVDGICDASLASRDCKPFTGGTQERWQPYE